MPSGVRYSETLRMRPSTLRELVGMVALAAAPLAVFAWVAWRPLGGLLVAGSVVAVSTVLWQARWQFEVRPDGLYYRLVPFLPTWRPIAAASAVTDVTADHDATGAARRRAEDALVPWSSVGRTLATDATGGVRIERGPGDDVFVSSRSPEAFASALRAVAN